MKLLTKSSKIICYLTLIISVVCFFFSLGITTDIYNLYLVSSFNVAGSEIYQDIQYFNKVIVNLSIISIILACTLFITRTHIRNKYYISNYINSFFVGVFNIVVSIIAILNIVYFKNYFLTEVDFEKYKEWTDVFKTIKYTESTFWFDINIIAFIFLILISICLLINVCLKNKMFKLGDSYER